MSQRRILRREGGSLSVAAESRFTSEEELHTAIASHPEVLPSEDVGLGPLVPLGSELDLGHGPIDLLCADGGGRPVIVEFKRGSENPDVRKVVAQVLDYGASLWRVDYDDLEQKCARCQPSFDGPLVDHVRERLELVGETSFDADAFRRGFEDALDAGDFVFLYVGRDLDARTKRIMTFLAEGPRMKFFAVEVDYFVDEETAVLVPRTAFVPSWAGAGSRETRDKAVTPIQERIDAAPRAVGELVVLMDRFAEEFGLIADYGENSRMYRPAPASRASRSTRRGPTPTSTSRACVTGARTTSPMRSRAGSRRWQASQSHPCWPASAARCSSRTGKKRGRRSWSPTSRPVSPTTNPDQGSSTHERRPASGGPGAAGLACTPLRAS